MYPTTIFEIIDESNIPTVSAPESVQPLFMLGFSSEKGPEDLRVVKSDTFNKLYGDDISFAKHGQPLLQAANIMKNGGVLLAKRVVADDATLANIAILAKVKSVEIQKVNAQGQPLYTDNTSHQETTNESGNTPIMITTAQVTYEAKSVDKAKDLATIVTTIESKLDKEGSLDATFVYPLFILADNGRGISNKRFRIAPDYNTSKYAEYMTYTFYTIEKNKVVESFTFTMNPDIIEAGTNKSLENVVKTSSNQLKAKLFEDNLHAFIAKVSEISGNTVDYCTNNDLLFGRDKKGNTIPAVKVDLESGSNLSYSYGLNLENGTNGEFGVAPFGTDAYKQKLVELFDGTFSNEIYDLDNYKIDLIVDANYPDDVKRAIESFVDFREDAVYLRDMGLNNKTIEDIVANNAQNRKSRYCATYCSCYDIIDPYTKKQISVTIGYSLSRLLIEHFKNGRTRPLAGQLYNMTIPEAIEGTINFLPKITPAYNQKETLYEERINYASYFDGVLTLETLFTSQEKDSQFSYINNVLAIQEVIKAIRSRCPKTRYSFIDSDDLEKYKEDVDTVLNKYTANFTQLKLVYTKDETMLSNKIFYATLQVQFRNFVQTEYFKIYALS